MDSRERGVQARGCAREQKEAHMFGLTRHERMIRNESARRCARASVALVYALGMAQACAPEDRENPQGMYTPPATAVDASSPSAMDASTPRRP